MYILIIYFVSNTFDNIYFSHHDSHPVGLVVFKLFLAAAMSSCSITEGARECFFTLLL